MVSDPTIWPHHQRPFIYKNLCVSLWTLPIVSKRELGLDIWTQTKLMTERKYPWFQLFITKNNFSNHNPILRKSLGCGTHYLRLWKFRMSEKVIPFSVDLFILTALLQTFLNSCFICILLKIVCTYMWIFPCLCIFVLSFCEKMKIILSSIRSPHWGWSQEYPGIGMCSIWLKDGDKGCQILD